MGLTGVDPLVPSRRWRRRRLEPVQVICGTRFSQACSCALPICVGSGAVGGLATASTALFALRLISSAVAVQSAPRPLLREVSWWRRRVLFVLFLWDFGRTRQFSLSLAVPLPFRYHGGYDFYPPYLSRYLLRLSVTPHFILYSGQVWPPNPRSVAGLADLGFLFMLPPTPRESSSGVRIGCTPLSVVTGPA